MNGAKPHLIMIAYHYPPAPEVGGLRPLRFRKYLQRLGYRCHLITASAQPKECADTFFVPDELRKVWDEGPDGRLSFKGWQELLIRKLMFPGHIGFIWSRQAAALCRKIVRDHPRDRFVLYSTYPPMGTLTAGLIVRRRDKIPWICDFRDPISGVGSELLSLQARFWNSRLEALTFRNADAIVANVEAAANVWRKRYPRAQQKLHVIYNGFDPEDSPSARAIPDRPHKLIVHAGALYHGRNPNAIIQSLARLRGNGIPEAMAARVVLLGAFDEKAGLDRGLYERAQRESWLELRPPVERAEAQRLLEEADGLLLVQPQTDVQVPGKLFEYICIGRPILALVPRSSAVEEILRESAAPNVCIYADDSQDAIDDRLLEFLRMPTAPNPPNAWFQFNFNASHQAEQLAAIIDDVALM